MVTSKSMRPTDSVRRALSPCRGAGHAAAAVWWWVAARPPALLQGGGGWRAVWDALLGHHGKELGERRGKYMGTWLRECWFSLMQYYRNVKEIYSSFRHLNILFEQNQSRERLVIRLLLQGSRWDVNPLFGFKKCQRRQSFYF